MNPTDHPNLAPLSVKGDCYEIDNSNLGEIASCPRKGFYKLLLRRRLRKVRAALFFGSGIHKALEVRDREQAKYVGGETESRMVDALIEHYEGAELGDDWRNLDYAIQTIQRYNTAVRFDDQTAITLPDGQVAVELPFALHVGDIPIGQTLYVIDPDENDGKPFFKFFDKLRIIFTGKIDRICKLQGELYLLDHKTTSIGGPTFFDEFFISLQFKGYKWAAEQLIGMRISGVIINALMCRAPLKGGGVNYTFDRQTIPISDAHVEEWQQSFLWTVREWFQSYLGQQDFVDPAQAFPMRTKECCAKYGKCEYFDVCQLPPNQRKIVIMSGLYEDHTWSPLEEEGKPKDATVYTTTAEPGKLTIADLFGQ